MAEGWEEEEGEEVPMEVAVVGLDSKMKSCSSCGKSVFSGAAGGGEEWLKRLGLVGGKVPVVLVCVGSSASSVHKTTQGGERDGQKQLVAII